MKAIIHKSLALLLCVCMVLMLTPVTTAATVGGEETAPSMTNVTVRFTDGTTASGTGGVSCELGQAVESITAAMDEAVTVTDGAVVFMRGTDGECAERIPAGVEYGAISLDTDDTTNQTLRITPHAGNETAGYSGTMMFTVSAGTVEDAGGRGNAETVFTLTVTAPVYNGAVNGTITSDASGTVSGTLTGDCELSISGTMTGYTNHIARFTGTVSGDIEGDLSAQINDNGIDTLSGIITGTAAAETVRVVGFFGQTEVSGSFEGRIITGPAPSYVDSMTIQTAGGADTVEAGDTLQMSVEVSPEAASDEVYWSVYVNDRAYAEIDENGLLTGLQPGTAVVIAKAADGSLADATKTITVTDTVGPVMTKLTATVDGEDRESTDGTMEWTVGETVTSVRAAVSEPVSLVSGASADVVLSGDSIPDGTVYGTLSLNQNDETGRTLLITPASGNETAGLAGIFTFTVAAGAVQDASGNTNEETYFTLDVARSRVIPVGSGVTPADGTAIDGLQVFTCSFASVNSSLDELQLDLYLGDDAGNSSGDYGTYSNSVTVNLPARAADVETLIDAVNVVFLSHTREQLVSAYGEKEVRVYEATGFRAGQDKAAAVKENIKYEGTAASGTWTLALNTYRLKEDALELLVMVTDVNEEYDVEWGQNNYAVNNGDDTKAFYHPLTEDTSAPFITGLTAVKTDGTTVSSTDNETIAWPAGDAVESITVVLNEPVEMDGDTPAQVTVGSEDGITIPEGTVYGTIALDGRDATDRTLIVTPDAGNETAAIQGTFLFRVAQGAFTDRAGNENTAADSVFTLEVGSPAAVYVDGNYTAESCGGYLWGVNAFAGIGEGIAAVASGGTVCVAAGTYTGDLTIDKTLTLSGAGAEFTSIVGSGTGVAVAILADHVTLRGFRITGSGTDSDLDGDSRVEHRYAGVGLQGVTDGTIEDNAISGCASGIGLIASSNHVIRDNVIEGCGAYGIILSCDSGIASTHNTISGNEIDTSGLDGMYLDRDCDGNTVSGNTITGTGTEGANILNGTADDPDGNGIYLWKSGGNTVSGNRISGNVNYGAEMMGAADNTWTGNTVTGNTAGGIMIRYSCSYASAPNTINGNRIHSNIGYGVCAESGVTSVNAENNWWGTARRAEIENGIDGNAVDYDPYYLDEAMTVLSSSDDTAPVMISVSPAGGTVLLGADHHFVLTVTASDDVALYELEIDHSMETTLPEFSVYADSDNPYGTAADRAAFESAGVSVTYDGGVWTIDFGDAITDAFVTNGGITFYLVLKDLVGNTWGSTYAVTAENTFAYSVTRDAAAPEMTGVTVTFTDGTTETGTDAIRCGQGKVVECIRVTMSEPVTAADGASVLMRGTAGDCLTNIPDSVTYGTISLDGEDTTHKTLRITPSGGNGTTGYAGTVTFTVGAGAVRDAAENGNAETTFVLTVSKVEPVGAGITPEANTTLKGTQTFLFPFTTTYGNLTELELDLYLGDNTGGGRDYSGAVSMNLPANETDLETLIDAVNDRFAGHTRAELAALYGENEIRVYEAAGFRAEQDRAAVVKENITYTGDTATGTWTLTLNTYMLREDALELLVAVKNDAGVQWGHNNFAACGSLTKAYLYPLTEDTAAPETTGVTVTFADGTTETGTDAIRCGQGKVVECIRVAMSEPVTAADGAAVLMQGTAGDCLTNIPDSVTYGAISLDGEDTTHKTLIITPSGGNGTAGYTGTVTFTVAAGAVRDAAENGNAETAFMLTVTAVLSGVAAITGDAVYGQMLMASLENGNNTGTLSYQWMRDGSEISGATEETYTPIQDDIGKVIAVRLTSSVETGFLTSASTAVVEKAACETATGITPVLSSKTSARITLVQVTGYEYILVANGAEISTGAWQDSNVFTNLSEGTSYEVSQRVKETETHYASAISAVLAVTTDASGGGTGGTSSGTGSDGTIDAETSDGSVTGKGTVTSTDNGVTVRIKGESFGELAEQSRQTDADVVVNTGFATVTFDSATVGLISDTAGSADVVLTVNQIETGTLSEENQQLIGDHPVYDFSLLAGSTQISDFNGGQVSISIPYTLKDGETAEAVVIYYIDDSGVLHTVEGAYDPATGTVDFTVEHFSCYALGYHLVTFSDVAEDDWYYAAVTFLAARDITAGLDDNRFGPNDAVTRGQFIVLLMRAYGIEPDENPADNFADAGDTYYTGYLAKARELGIAEGVGGDRFAPDSEISRQDMFTLLCRALAVLDELPEATTSRTLSDFNDVKSVSDYAKNAFEILIRSGVVSGNEGKLNPKGRSTRAEVAQVLYHMLQ